MQYFLKKKVFILLGDIMCGIALARNLKEAINLAYGLRHRGQDAVGFGTVGKEGLTVVKGLPGFFKSEAHLAKILKYTNNLILVHTRYQTAGGNDLEHSHPVSIGGETTHFGNYLKTVNAKRIMVHNGTVNKALVRKHLKSKINTSLDTELLNTLEEERGVKEVLQLIKDSYAVISMTDEKKINIYRDLHGRRPLWRSKKELIFASENRVIPNGEDAIEVSPGTYIEISPDGTMTSQSVIKPDILRCLFEAQYLGRPKSLFMEGVTNTEITQALGRKLREIYVPSLKVDAIIYLPNRPKDAAQAYAEEVGIPFIELLTKKTGLRSFIEPTQTKRERTIEQELTIHYDRLKKGSTVIVIDDSIIRGTNSKKAVEMLQKAGYHVEAVLSYTPILGGEENGIKLGCNYGVNMPPSDNFIATRVGRNPKKISEELGVPTYFLSVAQMKEVYAKFGIKKLCLECVSSER